MTYFLLQGNKKGSQAASCYLTPPVEVSGLFSPLLSLLALLLASAFALFLPLLLATVFLTFFAAFFFLLFGHDQTPVTGTETNIECASFIVCELLWARIKSALNLADIVL
jgi:hypothetical protein